MAITSSDLQGVDRTVRGAFMQAYTAGDNYTPLWPTFATRQTSEGRDNVYPLGIDAANVREWIEGERVFNGLIIESARVTNKKYELSYAISRDSLDDDLNGSVRMMVSRLRSGAVKYLRQPDKLAFGVIRDNGTCLDGLQLFSASHKINVADPASATFSNTTTGALTLATLISARQAMMEVKSADGEPINYDPKILLVPPALEGTARKIAGADRLIYTGTASDSPESNVWVGAFTVVVCPYLASAQGGSDTAWYLVDATDPEDRAIIYQVRQEVEIVQEFDPDSPKAFELDIYRWGTRARMVVAAGNPKRIFRRTG